MTNANRVMFYKIHQLIRGHDSVFKAVLAFNQQPHRRHLQGTDLPRHITASSHLVHICSLCLFTFSETCPIFNVALARPRLPRAIREGEQLRQCAMIKIRDAKLLHLCIRTYWSITSKQKIIFTCFATIPDRYT